jgi:signal transduction histidine kinase
MYLEMLEQGIAKDHQREQEYFRVLGSESSRLSRLINNVLEFSKLEKHQRHLHIETGTLEDVLKEVLEIMQEKLRQEGFVFNVDIQQIPPFQYDKEAMIQVLINLIENSIKFGKNSPKKEIQLRVYPFNDKTIISLSDTGPGIPQQALNKVFDDFYRADNALTRAARGTGIGLALVKKLTTAMGGTVKATNNPNSGCTVTISFG